METLLITKMSNMTLKTCFFFEENKFATIIEYTDGDYMVIEVFEDPNNLVDNHTTWCDFMKNGLNEKAV